MKADIHHHVSVSFVDWDKLKEKWNKEPETVVLFGLVTFLTAATLIKSKQKSTPRCSCH